MKALEIKNLKKVYANKVEALKGIDLVVESGEFFALLGPNGAGKSSIYHLMTGLISPKSGNINIWILVYYIGDWLTYFLVKKLK